MTSLDSHLRTLIRDEISKALAERDRARPDEYLSTRVAAEVASVATATIRRWVKSGALTKHCAGRVIRISRHELERLLKHGAANDELTPEQMAERRFR